MLFDVSDSFFPNLFRLFFRFENQMTMIHWKNVTFVTPKKNDEEEKNLTFKTLIISTGSLGQ